jgi:hypothetical protein
LYNESAAVNSGIGEPLVLLSEVKREHRHVEDNAIAKIDRA